MKVLQLKRPHDQEVFARKMKASSAVEEYRRWQCLYLISGYQVDVPFIADVTQLSVHSIYKLVQTFNRKGEKGIALQGRGGRRRYLLPLEQEKLLMKGLSEKAKSGQILQATDIKREVEAKVGKEVSDDYLWDFLCFFLCFKTKKEDFKIWVTSFIYLILLFFNVFIVHKSGYLYRIT